jgi:hypothetical protein
MAYSDAEKAEAIIRLTINKFDYPKTSRELGIAKPTLRRWNKNVPKQGVVELLERAVQHLLMAIPEKLEGNEWAFTVGTLIDKYLLAQGKPTARIDKTVRTLGLSQDEFDDVLAEANRIIEAAAGGSDPQGNSGTEG